WPAISWLYALPGFDLGAPSRASAVLACAVALLAGFGAESLIRRHPRALASVLTVAIVVACAGFAAWTCIEPREFAAVEDQRRAARHGVTLADVRALMPEESAVAAAEHWKLVGERVAVVALALAVAALFVHVASKRGASPSVWLPLFAVALVEG